MLLIAQCVPFLPTAAWASSADLRPVASSSVDPSAQKWTKQNGGCSPTMWLWRATTSTFPFRKARSTG